MEFTKLDFSWLLEILWIDIFFRAIPPSWLATINRVRVQCGGFEFTFSQSWTLVSLVITRQSLLAGFIPVLNWRIVRELQLWESWNLTCSSISSVTSAYHSSSSSQYYFAPLLVPKGGETNHHPTFDFYSFDTFPTASILLIFGGSQPKCPKQLKRPNNLWTTQQLEQLLRSYVLNKMTLFPKVSFLLRASHQ